MKSIIKYLLIAVIAGIGGTVFYNKVYIPKSTYERVSPQKGDLDVCVFGIGNVGAKNIYSINSQTGGKILKILSDEGRWVKKGELLVVIDSVDLPQLLEQSKVGIKKAKSEVVASQKELKSLVAQKHLLQVTYDRYAKLKKLSFASQSEYDKAKADLDAIDAQIEATKAHIKSADIEVLRLKKGVKALEVKLSRYNIYAPVDGYVIEKNAEVEQSVLPTQSILKIVTKDDVWVKAYIDEKISGDVKVGQKATITLRSKSDNKLDGYVSRIVAQSDAVTGEREVDVNFKNLPIPFYINEQAEVLVQTKQLRSVVTIPSNLIIYQNKKAGVWVLRDEKAHFLPIDVIAISEGKVAVKNLTTQEFVLVPSAKKKPLKEGSRVH